MASGKLEEEIGQRLREKGLTLAAAESATGGLISALITSVPGSSDYFRGGVVAYSNEVKRKLLGVNQETLDNYGAVSPQTAAEMAEGVRLALGADIGISDTGIAGPTGGNSDKPVGLFYVGVAGEEGVEVRKHVFSEDRNHNRQQAAQATLALLVDFLSSLDDDNG